MAKASKQVDTTPVTAPTLEPVQLTIADLQMLERVIDLASRRGAFQASELSQVGEPYNKLAAFLKYVASVQEKEKAEAEATMEATPAA